VGHETVVPGTVDPLEEPESAAQPKIEASAQNESQAKTFRLHIANLRQHPTQTQGHPLTNI
jgi:hypothetical protein